MTKDRHKESVGGPDMFREFCLAFVKMHLLHHASSGPVYGLRFIEEMERYGYTVSSGTVYSLLRRMETAGYLQREELIVDGNNRKYYSITPAGADVLSRARTMIQRLVSEISNSDSMVEHGGRSNNGVVSLTPHARRRKNFAASGQIGRY